MGRVIRGIESLTLWSGRISAWLTLAGVLILTYEVLGRYFFGYSWVLAHEVTTKSMGVLYVVAGAYAHLTGDHVGVDVFYRRLSRRAQAAVDVVMGLVFFVFVGAILVAGWEFFYDAFSRREHSLENPNLPVYPFKFFIPLGAALLLLQGFAQIARQVGVLLGRDWADVPVPGSPVSKGDGSGGPTGVSAATHGSTVTYGEGKSGGH